MKSLPRKGGALSQPGPKQPRIQIPAKPARGQQLPQQQPGHFPHAGARFHVKLPQGTPRPFQPPPEGSASPRAARAQSRHEAGGGASQPARDGGPGYQRPERRQLPRAAHSPAPLTGTRSFVGGLSSARLHLPAESHRAPLRQHPRSAKPPRARLPASAERLSALSNRPRGPAPPAQGRAEGEAGGREGAGARSSAALARQAGRSGSVLYSPQPGLGLSRICPRRAQPGAADKRVCT